MFEELVEGHHPPRRRLPLHVVGARRARSARPGDSDIDLLGALGRPVFVWGGANEGVAARVASADVVSFDVDPDACRGQVPGRGSAGAATTCSSTRPTPSAAQGGRRLARPAPRSQLRRPPAEPVAPPAGHARRPRCRVDYGGDAGGLRLGPGARGLGPHPGRHAAHRRRRCRDRPEQRRGPGHALRHGARPTSSSPERADRGHGRRLGADRGQRGRRHVEPAHRRRPATR